MRKTGAYGPYRHGNRWRVVEVLPSGTRRTRSFPSEHEAVDAMQGLAAAVEMGSAYLPAPRKRIGGSVYFVRAPSVGLVKIGMTKRPVALRVAALVNMSPVPVEVLAQCTVDRATDAERLLHERLQPFWHHAEWFHESETIVRLARALAGRGHASVSDIRDLLVLT